MFGELFSWTDELLQDRHTKQLSMRSCLKLLFRRLQCNIIVILFVVMAVTLDAYFFLEMKFSLILKDGIEFY